MENIKDPDALLKAMKRIGYKKDLGTNPKVFEDIKYNLEEEIKRRAIVKTSGYKKIENYMKDLARKPEFLNAVKEVRKKFDFPKGGFIYSANDDENCKVAKGMWENDEFVKYARDIAERYGVGAFTNFIFSYIVFNNFKFFSDSLPTNVIRILDLSPLSGKKTDAIAVKIKKELPIGKIMNEFQIAAIGTDFKLRMYSESYPIAILIHPYMSQRDILDAVKKIYKLQIEPIQKELRKEGIKFGTIRKKSERAEERNKFIYENRLGKSRKELVRLVNEKFGELMDYTYINKIIRDEREKNK